MTAFLTAQQWWLAAGAWFVLVVLILGWLHAAALGRDAADRAAADHHATHPTQGAPR